MGHFGRVWVRGWVDNGEFDKRGVESAQLSKNVNSRSIDGYKGRNYVLNTLGEAVIADIPFSFFPLRTFQPVDSFVDKSAQHFHKNKIRDS